MLQEIGLVVGLYIITRLVPSKWRILYVPLAVVTALVTLAVVADLSLRSITGNTLVATLAPHESEQVPEVVGASDPTLKPESEEAKPGYKIERKPDGPFEFSISGVKINEGSSLKRESILFNDPAAPVQITSHATSIKYEDRGFRFEGKTGVEVNQPIVAVQVRTILFDVFGQHMKNLGNTEPKDFAPGNGKLEGEWRAYENDITELLTTVTYVARVRLADGTQWIYNDKNLVLALASLNLEQEVGEQDQE